MNEEDEAVVDQSNNQLVHPGERVDYFIREQLDIIQSDQFFTFSVDAILLANFASVQRNPKTRLMDFCSGNGVIPLLLSQRTQGTIKAVEIQPELVDMARRSVTMNGLDEQIEIIETDLNELSKPKQLFDMITCNPPFFVVESHKDQHKLTSHRIARHELYVTMDQWIHKASVLLREKGKLVFVHRPERLDDIFETLLRHQFSVHRIKFVHPKAGHNAKSVLVEAIYRGGRQGVKIEPALVVHTEENQYTPEMQAIYFGEQ